MALNCEFTTLPGEGLLHISGPETLGFLQGQTTCDTRRLDASTAIPGAYCTPQGRVVCDFLLLQLGQEHVGLRMRSDILDASAATLIATRRSHGRTRSRSSWLPSCR